MLINIILLILGITFLALKYIYSYWVRNEFPNLPPSIPFGNVGSVAKKTQSFGVAIYDLYKSSTEPFVGIYLFFRPVLLVRELSLVRRVLLNDFPSFHDRGVYCNEEDDPMSASLFSMEGQRWKDLRQQLTQTFTSGKIKNMFQTYLDVGENLQKFVEPKAARNEVIEVKEIVSSYVIDIIASVAYGVEINSFNNPDNDFRRIATNAQGRRSFLNNLRTAAIFLCPQLYKIFRIHSLPEVIRSFMINLVKETIEHREKNNIVRKDLMQFLIQLRNTGEIDDKDWTVKANSGKKKLSIETIAAQVFIFFVAGFGTSSATIAYVLHEITQNPSLLAKLQKDIDETIAKHNGEITYDCVQEMKYLDLCVQEATRKYPALGILNRECTTDYKIPNSDKVLKKGTGIIISLLGLHRDPEYFPDPETFNPERFNDPDFNNDAFLPFGIGPRACIAFRMGRIISKVGLVLLLRKFHFEATEKREIQFDTATVPLEPLGGIPLKVSLRKVE